MEIFKRYLKLITVKRDIMILVLSDNKFLNILMYFLQKLSLFRYQSLIDIVCIDYSFRLNRFELCYLLRNLTKQKMLWLKLFVSDKNTVCSVSDIFPSAF